MIGEWNLKLQDFHKRNQTVLNSRSHDMLSTSESLREANDSHDVVAQFGIKLRYATLYIRIVNAKIKDSFQTIRTFWHLKTHTLPR